MAKLVTIFGGSGFVGRYIARRMAAKGWRVRVATRRPNEAGFVRTYGVVGQVEPVLANIRDEASVAAAIDGASVVVNCVGILDETGANSFDSVHIDGAARVARLAAAEGAGTLVQISAIGADAEADTPYERSKAEGEAAVLAAFPGAVILRPSLIFGIEDKFFNMLAGMARMLPLLPNFAARDALFQPVYVDDIAKAAELAALGDVSGGVYELGGPDQLGFGDLLHKVTGIIERKRVVMHLPLWISRVKVFFFWLFEKISLGIFKAPITSDQLTAIQHSNVVSPEAKGFADLGIVPVSMDTILPDYLWRFRDSGQFAEIKASAAQLKS